MKWFLGREEFREQMDERMSAEHYGEERTERDRAKAGRIVREELKRRRWIGEDLAKRLKGDREKVRIAGRLRAETMRTVARIAGRLHLGTRNDAN